MGRASRKKKEAKTADESAPEVEPEVVVTDSVPAEDSGEAKPPGLRCALLMALVLAVVVGFLFRDSFDPDKLLFANDAPWGIVHHTLTKGTDGWGSWVDTQWVGNTAPAATPTFTTAFGIFCRWLGENGSVWFSNFYAPASLWVLGMCAWLFFRQLGCRGAVCMLGGLAAALNGDFFSYACWGLPTVGLSAGMTFLAMAAIVTMRPGWTWGLPVLAGLAIGQGVMEGYDVGAIFSLYAAAFGMFWVLNTRGLNGPALARGVGVVTLMAGFAGVMAWHGISSLKETEMEGVVVRELEPDVKWDQDTQWSLPVEESVGVAISGLHGYRMDTDMEPDADQKESDEGRPLGVYRGRVGQHPAVERTLKEQLVLAEKNAIEQKRSLENVGIEAGIATQRSVSQFTGWHHAGYGVYAGVLVLVVGLWGFCHSFRSGETAPFRPEERRLIWFCSALALVSLGLAWGRHGPFYELIHGLPFFNSIRNPVKFMHPFSLLVVVLFGLGLKGISRLYMEGAATRVRLAYGTLQDLVNPRGAAEARWLLASVVLLLAASGGWLFYTSSEEALIQELHPFVVHIPDLAKLGVNHPDFISDANLLAGQIAQHSFVQAGLALGMFFLSLAIVGWISLGRLDKAKGTIVIVVMALFLVWDLGRGGVPYQIYHSKEDKYRDNPIFKYLRTQPGRGPLPSVPGMNLDQNETKQVLDRVQLLPRGYDAQVINRILSMQQVESEKQQLLAQIRPVIENPTTPTQKQMAAQINRELQELQGRVLPMMRTNTISLKRVFYEEQANLRARGFSTLSLQFLDLMFRDQMHLNAQNSVNMLSSDYRAEWLQHGMRQHGIPSIDIVQEPRPRKIDQAFREAFTMPMPDRNATVDVQQSTLERINELFLRQCELTSVRYFLCVGANNGLNAMARQLFEGMGYRSGLNLYLDPAHKRFRHVGNYDKVLASTTGRPGGRLVPMWRIEELGNVAMVEFSGALPRAKLFADWRQGLDDNSTLQLLASQAFDPHQQVILAGDGLPEPEDPQRTQELGTVELVDYAIKRIEFKTPPTSISTVLLLNDRHHPHWKVYVNGKEQELLRANFLMRGVYLEPSENGHTVEFRFEPPSDTMYVSMGGGLIGLVIGLMGCMRRREDDSDLEDEPKDEEEPADDDVSKAEDEASD